MFNKFVNHFIINNFQTFSEKLKIIFLKSQSFREYHGMKTLISSEYVHQKFCHNLSLCF
jgi:hypothetical protein